jgi:hypothetical protein
MRTCTVVLALALVGSTVPVSPVTAKTRASHVSQNLEIRINAENVQSGTPGKLALTIVKGSSHDVVIPKPTIDCGDLFRGSVSVQLDFTPLHPSTESLGHGHGCPNGVSDWPLILDRIKEWRTLRPSESIVVEADSSDWLFDFDQAGRYKVWGQYGPPEIFPHDQEILRQSGIDFPHVRLVSRSLIFNKVH